MAKKEKSSPVVPDSFDARLRCRNLSRGIISWEDVRSFEKALEDCSAQAEEVAFSEIVVEKRPVRVDPPVQKTVENKPVNTVSQKKFEIPPVIPAIDIPVSALFGGAVSNTNSEANSAAASAGSQMNQGTDDSRSNN